MAFNIDTLKQDQEPVAREPDVALLVTSPSSFRSTITNNEKWR